MAAPDRNPLLDMAGTHLVTPQLRFDNARGVLQQLWLPVDWNTHNEEWRDVQGFDAPAIGTQNETQNPPA